MKKHFIPLFHIGYWAFYLAMLMIVFLIVQLRDDIAFRLPYFIGLVSLFVLLPSILGFYFSYFFLFRKYLKDRSLLLIFAFGFLGVISVSIFCAVCIMLAFGKDFMFRNGYESFYSELLTMAIIGFVNVITGFVLKGFFSWNADLKIKEELQQYTHEMELELVKSKLDPHFLFNTINNIDGMMIKDVAVASKYLDKLSMILRFMLYESKDEKIPLAKEIAYIQKYIDLQEIRTATPDFVRFAVEGMNFKHQIPSMLFIPFIENAFKHVSTKKQPHAIEIDIRIQREKIIFHCKNMFNLNASKSNDGRGVGNELIEKRLELLYPNQHELITTSVDETYIVQLTIQAHEN